MPYHDANEFSLHRKLKKLSKYRNLHLNFKRKTLIYILKKKTENCLIMMQTNFPCIGNDKKLSKYRKLHLNFKRKTLIYKENRDEREKERERCDNSNNNNNNNKEEMYNYSMIQCTISYV